MSWRQQRDNGMVLLMMIIATQLILYPRLGHDSTSVTVSSDRSALLVPHRRQPASAGWLSSLALIGVRLSGVGGK
jgi:hypothetical protein